MLSFEEFFNESISNCIIGYHGSNIKGIEKFKLSGKGGRYGDGVYITSDKDEAWEHGNNVYKVKLCLNDPYIVSNGIGQIDKNRISKWFNNYTRNGETMKGKEIDDSAIIDYAIHDKTNRSLAAMGYDGILAKTNTGSTHYIVFDPDKVNIVNN